MTQQFLAASTGTPLYIDPIKIAVSAVLFFAWAWAVQWIDRDTGVVKTQRERWNLIVLSGSFVAFLVFFIPPWSGGLFSLGVAFWLLIVGATMLAYIFHRNGRVVPDARILTVGHLKRLLPGAGVAAKAKSAKGLQIRLNDHSGKFVEMPSTPDEMKSFELVQDFLYEILWRRVSDLDMTPGKEEYRVVYRIDGVAGERPDGIPVANGERIVQYLKKLAGLKVDEIRRPQTGRIQAGLLNAPGEPGFTEVKTSGSTAGERLMLHVQSGPALMRVGDIGLAAQREEIVKGFLGKKTGLVLISSAARHGLTTTQYAILRSHDAYMNNIYALERRKMVDLDNVTQTVYEGANSDVNFARMLQTILRREPDIVLVDNCEDRETARIASRAGAEDRKIYMGIQAKDCFDALSKYVALLEDHAMAAKALIGVTNQRLMRVLCKECREAFQPDEATLKKLNLPAEKIERFYRPPGEQKLDRKGKPIVCTTCQGTGYVGRVGVFEVMAVDPSVAALIAEGAPMNRIKSQCRKNKMYYLQEEGLLKVIDGTTSMNEVLRCLGGNDK
jgi:type II secretory ATPase GspE/PulE/Tfp pilus assembly ATPase PilB-like protein